MSRYNNTTGCSNSNLIPQSCYKNLFGWVIIGFPQSHPREDGTEVPQIFLGNPKAATPRDSLSFPRHGRSNDRELGKYFLNLKLMILRKQILGSEQSFGKNAMSEDMFPREAVLWMSVKHQVKKAIQVSAKEIAAAGTGGTPGISAVVGGRPRPSPCLKLYSFLHPKSKMDASITIDGVEEKYSCGSYPQEPVPVLEIEEPELIRGSYSISLGDMAFTRSEDKGNSCNIGVIARDPAYLPYIREQLTVEAVPDCFQHVF